MAQRKCSAGVKAPGNCASSPAPCSGWPMSGLRSLLSRRRFSNLFLHSYLMEMHPVAYNIMYQNALLQKIVDKLKEETTFAVATLGCKVNQADSEAISEQMSAAGFAQRDFSDIADVYVVNTCTVTHMGDRSSRQMISQARRRHPDALLVVTGCYAELNPQAVAALPGVNLVVGNTGKDSLVGAINEQRKTSSITTAHPVKTISYSKSN